MSSNDAVIVNGAATHFNGSLALDPVTGEAHHRASTQVNMGNPTEGGILASARDGFGSLARQLTPDSIVEFGGMTMRLREAEAAGIVRRDGSGNYSEATSGQPREPQQAHQQVPVEQRPQVQTKVDDSGDINAMTPEPFSAEVEAGLAKLAEGVPQDMVAQVLMSAVSDVASGKTLNLEDVISKTGMAPGAAATFMQSTLNALSAQADDALKAMQVDPEQFVQWAMQHQPEKFKNAMSTHVGVRSLNGYRALAKEFLRATTPSAEGLRQAGYETRVDPTSKELLVKYQGTWMGARAAALQGLI